MYGNFDNRTNNFVFHVVSYGNFIFVFSLLISGGRVYNILGSLVSRLVRKFCY